MLSERTILKLQELFEAKPNDKHAVLFSAGLPKTLINTIEMDGDSNIVIMRLTYILDGWEAGLQEEFEKNLKTNPLFKPVEPQSKSDKYPLLKVWIWEGSVSIVGAWGMCSPDQLVDIEKDIQDSLSDEKDNTEIMIQITGYTKPEYEGPDMTAPGYYEYDEISQQIVEVPF
jgi:hypothetical protein